MRNPALAALPLLLVAGAACAQTGPEAAERDLWCGLAFTHVVAEAPVDSALDAAARDRLSGGGATLTERAAAAFATAGHSATAFAARREAVQLEVAAQLGTPERDEPFSYEECSALLQ